RALPRLLDRGPRRRRHATARSGGRADPDARDLLPDALHRAGLRAPGGARRARASRGAYLDLERLLEEPPAPRGRFPVSRSSGATPDQRPRVGVSFRKPEPGSIPLAGREDGIIVPWVDD